MNNNDIELVFELNFVDNILTKLNSSQLILICCHEFHSIDYWLHPVIYGLFLVLIVSPIRIIWPPKYLGKDQLKIGVCSVLLTNKGLLPS